MANLAAIKAALLAMETLKEEKKRRNLLCIILAPVMILLIIIALIVHILTSPLSMFAQWLLPDELLVLEDFQADFGYTQSLGVYEEEDDYGQSYEGIFFTDSATTVTYYSQLDSRWADLMYGTSSTIGAAGCGPTSMAIVITTLLGVEHTPMELAQWSVENGYRCEGNGSYHSLIPNAAKEYGLACEGVGKEEVDKIVEALTSGKLVVAIMGEGTFTSNGHFIVLRGITSDGKVLVADPASFSRSEKEWKLSLIIEEARSNASAGGPFWIISL